MDFELRPQPPVGRTAADSVQSETVTQVDDLQLSTSPNTSSSVLNAQHLPPIDEGWKAWSYCASGFVLESLSWGFLSR